LFHSNLYSLSVYLDVFVLYQRLSPYSVPTKSRQIRNFAGKRRPPLSSKNFPRDISKTYTSEGLLYLKYRWVHSYLHKYFNICSLVHGYMWFLFFWIACLCVNEIGVRGLGLLHLLRLVWLPPAPAALASYQTINWAWNWILAQQKSTEYF
jgi:hypothetical protein